MRFMPRSEGLNCMIELQGSGYEDEDRTSFIKVNEQEVRTFNQGVPPFTLVSLKAKTRQMELCNHKNNLKILQATN